MYVLGIGIIFSGGRGIEQFERALKEPWHRLPSDGISAYQVDLEAIKNKKDKNFLRKIRRSDKFSKMSVLAASDAIANSGIGSFESVEGNRTGVVVATAFGPHVTTFKFLDDIIDYGDGSVSPTTFSNSVHNAAASYIAETFNIQGPTLTVTQFLHSFQNALQLAQLWLKENRCDNVLVGAVDQYGEVLRYIYDTKLTPATDGQLKPFNLKPTYAMPGEGAVFFLVSNTCSKNSFCEIEGVIYDHDDIRPDLAIIDTDGMLSDESVYVSHMSPEVPIAAYSPVVGSMMIGSAFNCAAGALMLRNQTFYANPVMDNPHGLKIMKETTDANIERISCTRYNCMDKKMIVRLKKK